MLTQPDLVTSSAGLCSLLELEQEHLRRAMLPSALVRQIHVAAQASRVRPRVSGGLTSILHLTS